MSICACVHCGFLIQLVKPEKRNVHTIWKIYYSLLEHCLLYHNCSRRPIHVVSCERRNFYLPLTRVIESEKSGNSGQSHRRRRQWEHANQSTNPETKASTISKFVVKRRGIIWLVGQWWHVNVVLWPCGVSRIHSRLSVSLLLWLFTHVSLTFCTLPFCALLLAFVGGSWFSATCAPCHIVAVLAKGQKMRGKSKGFGFYGHFYIFLFNHFQKKNHDVIGHVIFPIFTI